MVDSAEEPEYIIDVRGLVKKFGEKNALNGIDLKVRKGELFAFLGPNGAGKTTAVRAMSTLTGFDEGTIIIGGHDVVKEPKEAKYCIGVIQQHISLDKDLTVWENMMAHAMYQQLPKEERKKRIDELSEYIGLGEYYKSKVSSLSGGWQKRVAIVCALVHRPQLLFLDEPTVGLDIQARRGLWDLLRRLNDDGMTIFLTTHYIEEAESLCHHVCFIEKGKIIAEGTPEDLASKVGKVTVEYFGPDRKTQYRYFGDKAEANAFVAELGEEYNVTIRGTNLEDAFVEMTGNKIGDNGFMTVDGKKSSGSSMGGKH